MKRRTAHRLRTLLTAAALCLAAAIVIGIAVQLPSWERRASALPDPKDRLAAQNQIVATLIQLAGGLVVIVGLYYTAQSFGVAQQGQITDRFSKAIDHFSSTTLTTRLGGVHELARIAADSARDAETIVEIFASFLRDATANAFAASPSDVRTILSILGTADWATDNVKDLRACRFFGLDLDRLNLTHSLLDDAIFANCRLPGAIFDGSSLKAADLTGCYLRNSSFRAADLTAAKFTDASLRNANLQRAELIGANFDGTSLLGANFSGATNAIRQQFESAITDPTTQLPNFPTVTR